MKFFINISIKMTINKADTSDIIFFGFFSRKLFRIISATYFIQMDTKFEAY